MKDKYLKPVFYCCDLQLSLIQDILDFTKSSFQELRLVFEEVNLRELLAGILVLLKMKADIRNLQLIEEIHPDVPKTIMTEPTRLK